MPGMAGRKISNTLTALSSAAILAVHTAGYHRTSAAADRFAAAGDHDKPDPPIRTNFVAPSQALPSFKSNLAVPPEEVTPKRSTKSEKPASSRLAAVSQQSVTENTLKPIEAAEPAPVPVAALPAVAAPILDTVASDVPPPPPPAPPLPAALEYKDGTYTGWGSCRHGDIQASVVIQGGRIASTAISQCYTRYPCTWIADAPGQVVARQSIKVDYVSGATQSIDAFKQAVAEALSKAK